MLDMYINLFTYQFVEVLGFCINNRPFLGGQRQEKQQMQDFVQVMSYINSLVMCVLPIRLLCNQELVNQVSAWLARFYFVRDGLCHK